MKAIRVAAPGGPEVLRLEEIPTPVPGKGEALIRIAAAAGHMPSSRSLPSIG